MEYGRKSVTPIPSTLIRPFYPALDGLRALAFLAVFIVHYGPLGWSNFATRWGWVGVDLFFVLSGFLITGILHDSFHRPNYFGNFYTRRALRIFPLFYGFWILVLFLTPFLHIEWSRYTVSLATYLGNFFYADTLRLHQPSPGKIIFLLPWNHHSLTVTADHLWTLCVEEQFYLVWPAMIWLVRSRRTLLRICLVFIVLAPMGRALYLHVHPDMMDTPFLYANTLARVDTMLVGAAMALWLRIYSPDLAKLRVWAASIGWGAPILLAVLWSMEKTHTVERAHDPVVSTIGYTLIALSSAALVLGAIGLSRSLPRYLQWKPLAYLGRISYGMYFFHLFPIDPLAAKASFLRAHHLSFLILLLPFLYSLGFAWLSFRYFESPFLRLKSVLAPDRTHVADPKPAHTVRPARPLSVVPSHAA